MIFIAPLIKGKQLFIPIRKLGSLHRGCLHGINVVSPCYVLLAYCEQGDKGAGQFPCKGSQDLRIGADTAPLFLFPAGARSIAPNVMRRLDPNTIKYTNCTCRILGRRNRRAGTTPSSATSLSATPSFVALSSATVWGLSALVFTANAHIVIPNVMLRPAPNTIKYTNCTCRTVGRRNRHAGTTPSFAVVRPPFTFRRSYRRRHRLVSFSSKSFRFGDVAALPIRSPRPVTDEYWYAASAAPIVRRSGGRALPSRAGCGEVRESIIAIRQLFAGRSGNLTIRRLRRTAPCGGVAGQQLRYTP